MNDANSSYNNISPKYIVILVPKIEEAIWNLFDKSKYKNVKHYILRWQEGDGMKQNFQIFYLNDQIDLSETLHNMPSC